MTLDIKIINISQSIQDFFSYRSLILFILLLNILLFLEKDYIFIEYTFNETLMTHSFIDFSKILKSETHLEILGKALFRDYLFSFLFCGFILFIAMIGAIILTIEDVNLNKRQDIIIQNLRNTEHSVFNFKIYK